MKVFFVFIVVVVYGVVCQTPQPFPCQFPRKFTATLTDLKTINSPAISRHYMTLDLDRKMEALRLTTLDRATGQTTTTARTVLDFSQKRQYYIPEGDPSGSCYHFPLALTLPDTLPSAGELTQLGSGYVGLPGALPYTMISFAWQPGLNVTMVIDSEGCAPIVQGMSGLQGQAPIDDVYLYSNIVPNVIDPSVFDLPPSCN